jgi:hypothetical protein
MLSQLIHSDHARRVDIIGCVIILVILMKTGVQSSSAI